MKRETETITVPEVKEYIVLDCGVRVQTIVHSRGNGSELRMAQIANVEGNSCIITTTGETEGEAMRKMAMSMRMMLNVLNSAAAELAQEFGTETAEEN